MFNPYQEYLQMKKAIPMSTIDVEKDHLLEPKKSPKSGPAKVSKLKKFLKKSKNEDKDKTQQDTIESRAKAWFTAYKAWMDYTAKIESEDNSEHEVSTNQADLWTAREVEEILQDPSNDEGDSS